MMFIDFRQAFDTVRRGHLMRIMKELEIPEKLIKLVIMTLKNSKSTVQVGEGETEEFDVNAGVRQGDALSATLFNLMIESMIRKTNCSGTIVNKETQVMAYADDVVILSRTEKNLIETYERMNRQATEIGLQVSEVKTKYMRNGRGNNKRTNLRIGHSNFEEVDTFKYLGVRVNNRGGREEEIRERLQAGNRAFYANKKTLQNRNISKKTKMRIYKSLIRPTITYAAEVLCMTCREEERLRVFERKIVRSMMGPKRTEDNRWRARKNEEIEKELENEDIVRFIKSQRIRWLGHVMRREVKDPTRVVMEWRPEKERKRGRPRMTWWDAVMKDLRDMEIENWRAKCAERKSWRMICEQAKTHKEL